MQMTITPAAAARILAIAPGGLFRLGVEGGGCSGFRYVMGTSASADEGDLVFEGEGGARAAVDPVSADLLGGAVLDWVEDLTGSRFEVRNPNARSGCGCGASFAT